MRHRNLSIFGQAQSKVLSLRLQSYRSWPAYLPDNHRSKPETILTRLSTRQLSFQSWYDPDLPIYQITVVSILRRSWPASPNRYQSRQYSTRRQYQQIASRFICLLTRHFCKIKLTFSLNSTSPCLSLHCLSYHISHSNLVGSTSLLVLQQALFKSDG